LRIFIIFPQSKDNANDIQIKKTEGYLILPVCKETIWFENKTCYALIPAQKQNNLYIHKVIMFKN